MTDKAKNTLKELEKIAQNNNPNWNISPASGLFLNTLVKALQSSKILEIGTSNGYSGIWLASALEESCGELTTVESHKDRFEEAKKNFKKANLTKFIKQVFGHAPEILESLDTSYDLMFFDATKSEHSLYLKALHEKLKPGGVIITDNIISHAQSFKPYLDELQKLEYQSSQIPIDQGLLISLKSK